MSDINPVYKKGEDTDFRAPRASVLIVDDNKMSRMVVKSHLKHFGITPDEAESGPDMLALVREKKYDLIFLDHLMPDMDGMEALKIMRSETDHPNTGTPVIAMTANVSMGAKKTFIENGFNDYIGKPVKRMTVQRIVWYYLPEDLLEETEEKLPLIQESETEYPEIEGIDWKAAKRNNPDHDTLNEILKRFCSVTPRELEELEGFFSKIFEEDSKALDDYRIRVHSMKHSSALVGATELSARAYDLEKAAKVKNTGFIEKNHAEFCREYGETADRLRTEVLKETGEQNNLMNNVKLSDKLDILEQSMAALDMARLNDTVMELLDHTFESPVISEKIEGIREAVRDYDTDRFDSLIREIRDEIYSG